MRILDYNALKFQLQISPRFVRDMQQPDSFQFGPTRNPFPLFWLVLDGSRQVIAGGDAYTIRKGDLLLFPPAIPYQLLPGSPGESIHYLSLCCEIRFGPFGIHELYSIPFLSSPSDLHQRSILQKIWFCLIGKFDELVLHLQDRAEEERVSQQQLPVSLALIRLQSTLHEWLAQYLSLMQPFISKSSWELDPRVTRACTYIHNHAHEQILLEDIAAHIYVSPSHMNYLFRKSIGLPPAEYLRRYRIQLSRELLVQTSLSIAEIAVRAGYTDQSRFSRAFRKSEGISPMAYRQNWKLINGDGFDHGPTHGTTC